MRRFTHRERLQKHLLCFLPTFFTNDMLNELVYCSVATRVMDADDLRELLDHARSKNSSLGVTGTLLYNDQTREFIQLLEGDSETLDMLMEKISSDERHTSIDIMYRGRIETRSFEGWSMAYRAFADIAPPLREGITSFRPDDSPEDQGWSRASRARTIFTDLSKKM
ncbi:BLUF domain-containing protein [Rhodopirellula sallentina]|uniref:BLUF domain protein n=1 Tax=Rhodopirellula sallentina SM41 TaxID=1263870 RepID=M5U559_9BACT|nr:BLUF domain-containing protein [Rhodopirellula sallentina]EMI56580.1 BLUF domain protein [Rhodopirellula sallentina SM41]